MVAGGGLLIRYRKIVARPSRASRVKDYIEIKKHASSIGILYSLNFDAGSTSGRCHGAHNPDAKARDGSNPSSAIKIWTIVQMGNRTLTNLHARSRENMEFRWRN